VNEPSTQITELLNKIGQGNQNAAEQLVPLLYSELRKLARHYLRRERSDHTLQATALVHEAYLRLVDQRQVSWQNRNHFFAVAAQQMRRILVDYARGHQAAKRGGAAIKVPLDRAVIVSQERANELVAIDQMLTRLTECDPEQARVVELRIFGGLTLEEIAEILGVSRSTVKRDWTMAKAWLSREIRPQP
jgi:RNA polymerase sigma-70 factor, ECF subfamily